VYSGFPVRNKAQGRVFETGPCFFLEPLRLKKVQAVTLAYQGLQELDKPFAAFLRITVDNAHRILRSVAIAQAGAPARLDKAGETGEHHVDLALVQSPDIYHGVHVGVRRFYLKAGLFLPPVSGKGVKGRITRLG